MKESHGPATWILPVAMLLIWAAPGASAFCQDGQPADLMPREFSEKEAIQNVAKLKSGLFSRPSIAEVLELQRDILTLEIISSRQISEKLHEDRKETLVELERLDAVAREKISGAEGESGILVDRETTNLLMRNCLVELQRIDWELAAERGLTEVKSNNTELETARLDIDARKAELEAIAARLKSLADKPVNSSANSDEVLIDQGAKLKIAETELSKAKLRVDSLADATSTDSAARVAQLTQKRQVLLGQLQELKQQREVWNKVEPLRMMSDSVRKRLEATSEIVSQKEIEVARGEATLRLIQEALEPVDAKKAGEESKSDN